MSPEEQRKLDEWYIEATTKGLEHIDTVRLAFECWRKRERGARLVGRESILADHFERLRSRLSSEEDWFALVRQLLRTAEPEKISLSDAILSVGVFFESWKQIQEKVAAKYPGHYKNGYKTGTRWSDRRWQQERKKFPEF